MRSLSFLRSEKFLYLFAILASLMVSSWIAYRETLINTDAICYLLSAEAMGTHGFQRAISLCGQARWPFYSVLIYFFSQMTHFSYLLSAYVLDSFFSLLSVILFILIVKELGATKRILWLAAGVILLSHEMNSVREYIIRDHGFWTFYLSSLFLLLRFFKKPQWFAAFGFSLSLAIATLFRVEGGLFLLFLPFLCFVCVSMSWKKRLQAFLMLNMLTVLCAIAFILWLLTQHEQSWDKLGRLIEIQQHLHRGWILMFDRFDTMRDTLLTNVLNFSTQKEATLVLILVMLVWFLLRVIGNLSIGYAILVFYAWTKNCIHGFTDKLVLLGYLIINFFITFGFLAEHSFISKRYLIALSLVLMLFVPFALNDLITKSFASPTKKISERLGLMILAILILISALGGLFDFGYSKYYVRQAGDWLAKNIPQSASLYSNDISLLYYSKHFDVHVFEKMHEYTKNKMIEMQQFDYIALRLKAQTLLKDDLRKMASTNDEVVEKIQKLRIHPIQVFTNKRGDSVLIFKSQ